MSGIDGIATMLAMGVTRLVASSPRGILASLGISLGATDGMILDTAQHPPGRVLLARAGRSLRTRICPTCVLQDEIFHLPAEWDSAFAFTCDRHLTLLLDVCPRCGVALTYNREDLAACKCGALLAIEPPRRSVLDVKSLFAALSLPLDPGRRPTFAPSTEQEVFAAWLVRRLAIVDAGLFRARRAQRFAGNAFVTITEMQAVRSWFSDWPNGFIGKLAKVGAEQQMAPTEILGVSRFTLERRLPSIADAIAELEARRRSGRRPSQASNALLSNKQWVGLKRLMKESSAGQCIRGDLPQLARFVPGVRIRGRHFAHPLQRIGVSPAVVDE